MYTLPARQIRFVMRYLLLVLLCLTTSWAAGQLKYEKEYRIRAEAVPEPARAFIRSGQLEKNIRWYAEENLDGKSVEAKTKHRGNWYSIEFDTLGNLQDIEIEVAELPEAAYAVIEDTLKRRFEAQRIRKIQLQYTGSTEALGELLHSDTCPPELRLRYELIVKGRDESGVHLYEMLFSEEGALLHTARVVLRNTDNLEY